MTTQRDRRPWWVRLRYWLNPLVDVPPKRRRAISRAIRDGTVLRDPDDARLLLRAAAARQRSSGRLRAPFTVLRLVAIAYLAVELLLALGRHHAVTVDSTIVILASFLAWDLWRLGHGRARALLVWSRSGGGTFAGPSGRPSAAAPAAVLCEVRFAPPHCGRHPS